MARSIATRLSSGEFQKKLSLSVFSSCLNFSTNKNFFARNLLLTFIGRFLCIWHLRTVRHRQGHCTLPVPFFPRCDLSRCSRTKFESAAVSVSFPSALPLFQQLDDRIADLLVRVALREIFANVLPLEFVLLLLIRLLLGEDVVDRLVLQYPLLRKLL